MSALLRSVRLFLGIAKIFGLFGCSVNGDRVKRSSLAGSVYASLWLAINYCYVTMIEKLSLNYPDINAEYGSLSDNVSSDGDLYLGMYPKVVFVNGEVLVSIFEQRRIVRYFERMDDHDRRLKALGFFRQDDTRIYWTMFALPLAIVLVECCWKILFFGTKTQILAETLLYYGYYFLQYFIVLKFCMLVHLIRSRFRYLNDKVASSVTSSNDVSRKPRTVTVFEVRYLHTKLCEAGELLSEVYGLWVIVWCLNIVLTATRIAGYILDTTYIPHYVGVILLWLVCLCWNCGAASDEANETISVLLATRPLSGDAADTMDRTEMALYLFNHQLTFSALGVYSINRTFLLQLTGIILTYLTIVMT